MIYVYRRNKLGKQNRNVTTIKEKRKKVDSVKKIYSGVEKNKRSNWEKRIKEVGQYLKLCHLG